MLTATCRESQHRCSSPSSSPCTLSFFPLQLFPQHSQNLGFCSQHCLRFDFQCQKQFLINFCFSFSSSSSSFSFSSPGLDAKILEFLMLSTLSGDWTSLRPSRFHLRRFFGLSWISSQLHLCLLSRLFEQISTSQQQ